MNHRTPLAMTSAGLALLAATTAQGQASAPTTVPSIAATIAAMPKNLPRAPGPDLTAAIDAAQAAHQACTAQGAKVSVLVADTVGLPVVLLSGDGAGVRSQLITRTKAAIVARYGMASGAVAERAKTHPELAAEAAADPDIGELRGGGFPTVASSRRISVRGGPIGRRT